MIQLRNLPDALHRSLKARAAMLGTSLSDYLLAEIREIAERPTLAEFRERLHTRKAASFTNCSASVPSWLATCESIASCSGVKWTSMGEV